jgi:lipid-binding SYLF domain-containing protein
MSTISSLRTLVWVAAFLSIVSATTLARADTAAQIDRNVSAALQSLYASHSGAKALGANAVAVLVFPRVVKAGLVLGGQHGEGALRRGGKTIGYFTSAGITAGLQAGAQTFGYALFFMTKEAYNFVGRSNGWEIGTGPTVVVINAGATGALTTTTAKDDIYAFFFNEGGLMVGLSLQGTKISRLRPRG